MADINTATLIGRLTRDEEVSYTPGGMPVGNLSLAINRKVKKGQEWVDEVNYFDVVIYGKQAESLKQYLTKGKQVAFSGYLKQERWTDKNSGQTRSAVKLIATDTMLLGGRDGGQRNNSQDNGYPDENYDPNDNPF